MIEHFYFNTKVASLNTREQKVVLDNGIEIRFDKLLIAPGKLFTVFSRHIWCLHVKTIVLCRVNYKSFSTNAYIMK